MIRELSTSEIDPKKYPVFLNIKNNIAQLDKDLHEKKLDHIISKYIICVQLCETLKKNAIEKNDEYVANVSFFLKTNVFLIKSIAQFWKSCEDIEFPTAWSFLQDALYYCRLLLKFCSKDREKAITSIYDYLLLIEQLFPYTVFISSASEGIETKCSICDRSSFDPDCLHITGELYWGEIATNIVIDLMKMDHIAFVPNPADKRCVITIENDKRKPENSPFKNIHTFIKNSERPLRNVTIQKTEQEVPRSKFRKRSELWPCPCGSELPFIECCYDKEVIKVPHISIFYNDDDPQ